MIRAKCSYCDDTTRCDAFEDTAFDEDAPPSEPDDLGRYVTVCPDCLVGVMGSADTSETRGERHYSKDWRKLSRREAIALEVLE